MIETKKKKGAKNKMMFFIFQTQTLSRSKADLFKDKLASLLKIDKEKVDVFSVQLRRKHPPLTDIRFAAHGSSYYKPVRLNGIVLMHREEVADLFSDYCYFQDAK